MNRPLSSNLASGRKIPLPVEIAAALHNARRPDGSTRKQADRLALYIQQIQHWLDVAQENRDMERDGMKGYLDEQGRLWFYNGMASWKRNFPMWSEDTIRDLRDELVELGIVLTQVRSKVWDALPLPGRTITWYSLNYEALDALGAEEVPPGIIRGGGTSEGVTPGVIRGDPPGNMPPQQRVFQENTLNKEDTGSVAPASIFDANAGQEIGGLPPANSSGSDSDKENDKLSVPENYTNLERWLCELLGQNVLAKAARETLSNPSKSEETEDAPSPNSLYDDKGTGNSFRKWIAVKSFPWWRDNAKGSGSRRLAGAVANYDWFQRWLVDEQEEYTLEERRYLGFEGNPNDNLPDDLPTAYNPSLWTTDNEGDEPQ